MTRPSWPGRSLGTADLAVAGLAAAGLAGVAAPAAAGLVAARVDAVVAVVVAASLGWKDQLCFDPAPLARSGL